MSPTFNCVSEFSLLSEAVADLLFKHFVSDVVANHELGNESTLRNTRLLNLDFFLVSIHL